MAAEDSSERVTGGSMGWAIAIRDCVDRKDEVGFG